MRKRLASTGVAIALALVCAPARAQHASEPASAKPVPLLSGLGLHRHPIATSVAEAQKFFDQGMILLFGFNHEEALRAFAKAAEAEKIFRDDLERNPRNPRSLLGLAAALSAQGRTADAAWARTQFDAASRDADVPLRIEDL